jgi:hypothetical protein
VLKERHVKPGTVRSTSKTKNISNAAKTDATDSKVNYGLTGWGIEPLVVAPIALLILLGVALTVDPVAVRATSTAVVALSPVWLTLFLLSFFWTTWIDLIRFQFWFGTKMVLLEVVLPPEVEKSPLAMETFMTSIWDSSGETTFLDRTWKGKFRAIWSLEIASNEGRVSFYMYIIRAAREIVESRLYGHFPEAKIIEVEDYASKVHFNLEEWDLFAAEYAKGAAAPLPIKTYYDYELNKDPDAPEKTVDPITNTLELLSSIGKDEYLWLQFIAKARKRDEWYGFYLSGDAYKDAGTKAIKDIMETAAKRVGGEDKEKREQALSRGAMILTQGERDKVEAIEKQLNKLVFETGIRCVYLAKKTVFDNAYKSPIARLFNPYRTGDYNQLNPTRGLIPFDYPWQDFANIRQDFVKKRQLFFYRERAYFYVPYDQAPIFLTIEELASLWHFPNSRVAPPGLERVASKRAEAPAGLPSQPAI